ncbi:hypothetical protein FRC02_010054 [Tulasnella sp. 418]|nr:hypothetical protein FRC02_010054 [Tulasnella sp. 418]
MDTVRHHSSVRRVDGFVNQFTDGSSPVERSPFNGVAAIRSQSSINPQGFLGFPPSDGKRVAQGISSARHPDDEILGLGSLRIGVDVNLESEKIAPGSVELGRWMDRIQASSARNATIGSWM